MSKSFYLEGKNGYAKDLVILSGKKE